MRISLPILALGCLLYGGNGLAASLDVGSTGDHVRVILDTSKSMCGAACGWQDPPNDPGRLSILSTLLLHDLLKPDPNKAENPDSFAVIPFGQEKWTDGPPPASQARPRRAKGMAARSAFADELRVARLPFDAMNTYYSPSIEQALNDLPPLTPESSEATTRTIVLITDGRSVLPDADAAYIKDQLLPKLAAMQARLYVIMFGPDARQYGEAFFRDIEQADTANTSAGRYAQRAFPSPAFIVDTGKELPETMIQLFSESFGYLHSPADDRKDRIDSGGVGLNLNRGAAPTEAAIVALTLDPTQRSAPKPPQLELLPPPGGSVNPQPLRTASEPGGAYSVRWELTPSPGDYRLRIPNGGDASVFVLRPTNLTVDLREHRERGTGAGQTDSASCFAPGTFITMADTPCKVDFVVKSAAGTQGIPPALTLTYWIKQPQPGGTGYWNSNDEGGVGIGAQDHWDDPAQDTAGRRYWSLTQFKPNQIEDDRSKPYKAQLTVNVDLQNKTVAFRDAADPFAVTVYPRLRIAPDPAGGATLKDPATGALEGGSRACTVFYLEEDPGTRIESALAGSGGSGFNVRAFLSADPQALTGALRDSKITLDGETVGFQSTGASGGDNWARSKPRTLESLVRRHGVGGRHELCVTLGPYADGDPAAPPALQVRFILDHPPYDRFDAIGAFQVKVLVAKAPPLSWRSLLPFLLLALGLLLALFLLRTRSVLPKDLNYALASESDPHGFMPKPLPAPHPLRALLSRKAGRRIEDSRGELLGWVRPEDESLYSLRPAPGVTVTAADGAGIQPERSGTYLLEVHRPYRLVNGEDRLLLRMQFA